MLTQKIIATGNSLAVTIPANLVKSLGLKATDGVKVEFGLDQSSITYHFSGSHQLTLASQLGQSNFSKKTKTTL